jgi:hypothetical protein
MKTMLIPILTVAAVSSSTLKTFADLERKDSSQFDYKYEMVESPTAQDVDKSGYPDFAGGGSWFTLGTGVNVGSCSMVMSGGQYLKADAASSGATGDVWRVMNATAGEGGTGYTVEARVKVTESTGSIGAFLLNASTGDSTINSWLVFRTDSLYWGNGTDRKIVDIDATAWHTYRIVREPGSIYHSLYVDGVLVTNDLPNGISASVNRIILGSTGGDYKGKAQIAWLRFTKGAYAPVDEKAYVKANRLRSDQLDLKYKVSDDTLVGNWTQGGSGASITSSQGILSVTTSGKSAYWDTKQDFWRDLVDKDTSYTVEFKVRINKTTHSSVDRALNLMTGSNGAVSDFFIGTNSVQWCLSTSGSGTFVTLDTSDNTDKFHRFRIAYDGATRHGFTVWRDDVVIGENLVDCVNFYNFNGNALGNVRFGKSGGLNDGSFDVDYIRWKIGGVYPPDTRKGMKVIIR